MLDVAVYVGLGQKVYLKDSLLSVSPKRKSRNANIRSS